MDTAEALAGLLGAQELTALGPERVEALLADGPLVRLVLDGRGKPAAAVCLLRVAARPEVLWQRIRALDDLPRLVQMMEAVDRLPPLPDGGEQVRVRLRFHLAFFSVRFHFVARLTREEGRALTLDFLSGKVRDVRIRLETAPLGEDGCVLRTHVGFDPFSMGWLAGIFLRHHPEIEWGVHTGAVLSVAQAARALAEAAALAPEAKRV
jgi:hypothetical protein